MLRDAASIKCRIWVLAFSFLPFHNKRNKEGECTLEETNEGLGFLMVLFRSLVLIFYIGRLGCFNDFDFGFFEQ